MPLLLCNHSPTSSFEVKNMWSFTSIPHTPLPHGDYLSKRNVLLIFLPLWNSMAASRIKIQSIPLSFNSLTPELNPYAQRCLTRFLLGILLLEPCISLIYASKTNKYTNYSFSLLIMYGISYMFRHYIAILREHS
jgi:hypothetical protein